MSNQFHRKVRAKGFREAPVLGVEGKIGIALAHAFTADLFHDFSYQTADRVALRNSKGLPQVVFAEGMWRVVGPSWGQYNVPQKILWWASVSLCDQIKKTQKIRRKMDPRDFFEQILEAVHLSFNSNPMTQVC